MVSKRRSSSVLLALVVFLKEQEAHAFLPFALTPRTAQPTPAPENPCFISRGSHSGQRWKYQLHPDTPEYTHPDHSEQEGHEEVFPPKRRRSRRRRRPTRDPSVKQTVSLTGRQLRQYNRSLKQKPAGVRGAVKHTYSVLAKGIPGDGVNLSTHALGFAKPRGMGWWKDATDNTSRPQGFDERRRKSASTSHSRVVPKQQPRTNSHDRSGSREASKDISEKGSSVDNRGRKPQERVTLSEEPLHESGRSETGSMENHMTSSTPWSRPDAPIHTSQTSRADLPRNDLHLENPRQDMPTSRPSSQLSGSGENSTRTPASGHHLVPLHPGDEQLRNKKEEILDAVIEDFSARDWSKEDPRQVAKQEFMASSETKKEGQRSARSHRGYGTSEAGSPKIPLSLPSSKGRLQSEQRSRFRGNEERKIYSPYVSGGGRESVPYRDAVDRFGDYLANSVDSLLWGTRKDKATTHRQGNSPSSRKAKGRWKGNMEEKLDRVMGIHKESRYYNRWVNSVSRKRQKPKVNSGGRERESNRPVWKEEDSLVSLLFGSGGRKRRRPMLSLSLLGSRSIMQVLQAFLRSSALAVNRLSWWASVHGTVPQPVVVVAGLGAALLGRPGYRLRNFGLALLTLRTIAEAIHSNFYLGDGDTDGEGEDDTCTDDTQDPGFADPDDH